MSSLISSIFSSSTRTPEEALIDSVNALNSTELFASDFDFSAPVAIPTRAGGQNTKVTITPKSTSAYTRATDLYYRRVVASEVFDNENISLSPTTEGTLKALIPKINMAYGLNLSAEDVVDELLPSVSGVPGVLSVVSFVSTATSLQIVGSYDLQLGAKVAPPAPGSIVRSYAVAFRGLPLADYQKTLVRLDADGAVDPTFLFLRNVTDVTACDVLVDNVFETPTGYLLNGTFAFTNQVGNPVSFQAISIDLAGRFVSGVTGDQYINPVTPAASYKLVANDSTKMRLSVVNGNSFKRLGPTGSEIIAGAAHDITDLPTDKPPSALCLGDDQKVYIASPVITAVVEGEQQKQIKIYRVTNLLELDTSFTPVIITDSGSLDPLSVASIVADSEGFWVMLAQRYGCSVARCSVVINGTVLFGTATDPGAAWNPVLRFKLDGSLDTTFDPLMAGRLPDSFYSALESLGDKAIKDNGAGVTLVTYRPNPVTGHPHFAPVIFNGLGHELFMTGNEYDDQPRVTEFKEVQNQIDGSFVIAGKYLPRLISGGYGAATVGLVRFLQDGSFNKVLYSIDAGTSNYADVEVAAVVVTESVAQ